MPPRIAHAIDGSGHGFGPNPPRGRGQGSGPRPPLDASVHRGSDSGQGTRLNPSLGRGQGSGLRPLSQYIWVSQLLWVLLSGPRLKLRLVQLAKNLMVRKGLC